MIEKLPHIYLKEKLGNLYKIFEVIKDEVMSIEEITHQIETQDELNSATGISLDRHGELVGQRRAYLDDKSYRLLIKLRIRQNLSGGDIPNVNEFFTLILGNNYLGIAEGWDNGKYNNEPALVVFRYIHEIIEGGIEPVNPVKLDGSVDLDGEYSLDSKIAGYFDSEIINFAKSLAKKVIAAGVKVVWETPVEVETSIDTEQTVAFDISQKATTREVVKLDGTLLFDGDNKLDANIPFVNNNSQTTIHSQVSPTQKAFLDSSLKLDGGSQMDGLRNWVNQGGLLKVYDNSVLIEEVAI
ncbi:MAG: DUF2612 domain-containing protein [Vallitaleaceae bacterium]|nr:DUF2612 domain-containing protein [Vallitaleaceae bacterium]